jgi:hypothetical protein
MSAGDGHKKTTSITTFRLSLADLSGDILDLISEYLPQKSEHEIPPVFTMCSSQMLKSYSEYKRENYGI